MKSRQLLLPFYFHYRSSKEVRRKKNKGTQNLIALPIESGSFYFKKFLFFYPSPPLPCPPPLTRTTYIKLFSSKSEMELKNVDLSNPCEAQYGCMSYVRVNSNGKKLYNEIQGTRNSRQSGKEMRHPGPWFSTTFYRRQFTAHLTTLL